MAEIPEYNRIDYKNDSRIVIYAKSEAIRKAGGGVYAGGINAPAIKPNGKSDKYIPEYNRIDYENDSLTVIEAKEKVNGTQKSNSTVKKTTAKAATTQDTTSKKSSTVSNGKTQEEKLKEAEARKKKLDKEYQEKTALAKKSSDSAIENVQKYIADQVRQSTEKREKTVSSAEALKDMQSSVKNIWQGIISPVSDSLNQAVQNVKSDEAAKQFVDEIRKGAQGIGKIEDFLKGKDGFSEEELLKLSTKALLGLQQDILSQNMTHQAVLDGIAKRIAEQAGNIEKLASSVTEQYLLQKAYINAYLKNTFGNPEFMSKVSKEIEGKVTTYIDALSNEKINMVNEKIDSVIDNTFSRVASTIDTTTNRINTKLDDLLKLDIVNDINSKLEKSISLEAFEKRLNANPLTQILAPSIMSICQAGQVSVLNSFKQPKMLEAIKKVQDKVKIVQDNLKKAKDLIANKTKMLKEYVDTLKKKATEAVKQFANKVISDIKSKISVALGNAIGGAISGLAAGF